MISDWKQVNEEPLIEKGKNSVKIVGVNKSDQLVYLEYYLSEDWNERVQEFKIVWWNYRNIIPSVRNREKVTAFCYGYFLGPCFIYATECNTNINYEDKFCPKCGKTLDWKEAKEYMREYK